MATIGSLFAFKSAKSVPFDDHLSGTIRFVTNGYRNNGVVGCVTPEAGDKVFDTDGICVSAFCQATVQRAPFVARGNGGSGLTVLVPKKKMTEAELWGYASFISSSHRWKFSFGRMATAPRLAKLHIPDEAPVLPNRRPHDLLPVSSGPAALGPRLHFELKRVDRLFLVNSGEFHSAGELPSGTTPLISCGDQDNGIIGFVSVSDEAVHANALTIAYNGDWPLMAKFHPYTFAAKDDVAVLTPLDTMALPTALFIQMLFNREIWRHSYGRKLYRGRLEKFELRVPWKAGSLDHDGMAAWLASSPLWGSVASWLGSGLHQVRRETLALVEESH
jgi:hypothetical protein